MHSVPPLRQGKNDERPQGKRPPGRLWVPPATSGGAPTPPSAPVQRVRAAPRQPNEPDAAAGAGAQPPCGPSCPPSSVYILAVCPWAPTTHGPATRLTQVVPCPQSIAGRVIGPGGSTIMHVRQTAGAGVLMCSSPFFRSPCPTAHAQHRGSSPPRRRDASYSPDLLRPPPFRRRGD